MDDEDYEYLSAFKWHWVKDGNTVGYAARNCRLSINKRVTLLMHKAIFNHLGLRDSIDHINRNGLDNRRNNLRPATQQQNNYNKPVKNTSGFKGVSIYFNKKKNIFRWRTRVYANGKNIPVGYFKDKVEAAKAYDREVIKWQGNFAWLNFPSS